MKNLIFFTVLAMSLFQTLAQPCSTVYTTVMNRSLESLRGSYYRLNLEQAKQYMLILKEQIDLELEIRALERTAFTSQISTLLRIPLNRYQECKVVNFDIRAPMPDCNNVYTSQAQKALALLRDQQTFTDPKLAERYMLLLKQDNDLDTQIQEFERTVFSGELVSLLRMPLQRYVDCNTVLGATVASRA
ncbi:hypothetical protein H0X48_01630 [Candidatus Dependentiae bacterium]|nr:hypothetical protein [Candidatus Dependentiae bacterium]